MLDSKDFFNRICEALGFENTYGVKAKIADKLHISRAAVGFWDAETVPGEDALKNVVKIAELSGTSLHWLLTGQGDKYVIPPKQMGLEESFREIIREIVRDELNKPTRKPQKKKGAQTFVVKGEDTEIKGEKLA